jgi:hypothetical protein
MIFKFYSKTDSNKDAIGKASGLSSFDQAYEYFAAIKKMDVNTFKKLFSVEVIK